MDKYLLPEDDGLPARESGEWVKEKLFYVQRYIDIFETAMRQKSWRRRIYIDLFAGPGKCIIRGTNEYLWMGTSVENEKYKFRIDHLRQTGAKVKFLSIEPLIGPVGKLNLKKINWVIVGGESGPGARPIMQEWVTDIRDQCLRARVPFFFKQWGGVQKKRAGRILEGRTWDEMPIRLNLVQA